MNNNSKQRFFYLLNIVVPLTIGFIVYLLFRKDTFISQFIRRYLHFNFQTIQFNAEWLNRFFRNFAADYLWAYALAFSVAFVLAEEKNQRILSLIICCFFTLLIEFGQKIGVIHGTFDIIDILIELVAISVALQRIKKYGGKNNEKQMENS